MVTDPTAELFKCPALIVTGKQFELHTSYTKNDGNLEHLVGSSHLIANPLNNNDVDGIQFLFSSGNITSGKVKVYGF